MESLYDKNGLVFWSQEEIELRHMFEQRLVQVVTKTLKTANAAFEMFQVEAPILTPRALIDPGYTDSDIYAFSEEGIALRPETTMGSYAYARHLLSTYNQRKVRMPLCVWQHGKSLRREQDQVAKNMRLKEFYQLEFQCIYSPETKNDYARLIYPAVGEALGSLLGPVRLETSDRLPSYSEKTVDVVVDRNNMEICSMSLRTDFEGAKVLEIAIGTDRCVRCFLEKNETPGENQ